MTLRFASWAVSGPARGDFARLARVVGLALVCLAALVSPAGAAYECFTLPNRPTAFVEQANVYSQDFQVVTEAIMQTGVVWSAPGDCLVTAQGTPDMTVHVAACTMAQRGTSAAVTAGNVTISPANASFPRIDYVSADNTGAKIVTAGTPALSPVPPTIPQSGGFNNALLAEVYVQAGDTAIAPNQIVDKRGCIPNPAGGGGGGSGDVTHVLGPLTANAFILGNGGDDVKALAVTGLVVGNGASAPTPYAGTSCSNSFPRSLNASGAATCAPVGTADVTANAVTLDKLATQADDTILSNISGGAAVPAPNSLTAILDSILGTTQGALLYRNATVWTTIPPGTSGQILQTGGAAANPSWATAPGGGNVSNSGTPTSGQWARWTNATTIEGLSPAAARAAGGLNIDSATARGDANYTILATDRIVYTTADFAATRTWTLPAASAVNAGQTLCIIDAFGGLDATNFLTLARAGSDTINGLTTLDLKTSHAGVCLVSDGAAAWTWAAGNVTATALTPNSVAKASSPTTVIDSCLGDNGTTATVGCTGGLTTPSVMTTGTGPNMDMAEQDCSVLPLSSAGRATVCADQTHTVKVSIDGGAQKTLLAGEIPTATPMLGSVLATAIGAPSTPATGLGAIYVDNTSKNLAVKDDAGVIKHMVKTRQCSSGDGVDGIADDGSVSCFTPGGGGGGGGSLKMFTNIPESGINGTKALSSLTVRNVALFTLPVGITANLISTAFTAAGTPGTFKLCIYSADGATKHIDATVTPVTAATGWSSVSVSAVALSAGTYYAVVGCATTCSVTIAAGQAYVSATALFGANTPSGKLVAHGTVTHTSGTCNATLGTVTGTTDPLPLVRLDN